MAPNDAPEFDRQEKVSGKLEDLTEQFITDGIQEWSLATASAITSVPLPQEEESIVYWLIALAGNMAWAGTVFMRPLANGLPSPAQKAISVIGAGFGSDTVRQVKNLVTSAPSPDRAKEFFAEISAIRADQMEKSLVEGTSRWVRDDFYPWATRRMRDDWWRRNNHEGIKVTSEMEKQREQWINEHILNLSAIDKNALRHYAYKEYVFPGFFYAGKIEGGAQMRRELLAKMVKAVSESFHEYKTQYEQWQFRVRRVEEADSRRRLAPGAPGFPPAELRVPFEPTLTFAGLSLATGKDSITAGQLVRRWKYGRDSA